MSFKDLLVHIDDSEECLQRVKAAVALAKRKDARVRGIALSLESTISTYIGAKIPADFLEAQQALVKQAAEGAVESFEKFAEAEGVEHSGEIVTCSATKAPAVLAFHARHADIMFLGQPNPDKPSVQFHDSILDGVLFASGRPIYVVPYIGRPDYDVRKAVIGWDGGKKAARAVNDAIALLQGRGEVVVLVLNPEERREAHGDNPGADIAAHLERHGVETKVVCDSNQKLAKGTALLNYLTDVGADLLVMGAYGHSRLREKAFGGATNTILHQMTVPVFMAE